MCCYNFQFSLTAATIFKVSMCSQDKWANWSSERRGLVSSLTFNDQLRIGPRFITPTQKISTVTPSSAIGLLPPGSKTSHGILAANTANTYVYGSATASDGRGSIRGQPHPKTALLDAIMPWSHQWKAPLPVSTENTTQHQRQSSLPLVRADDRLGRP